MTNPDILYTIFDLVVYSGTGFGYSEYDLVAMTHVCRFWRSLILSSPALWRYINCANMRWVNMFLKRCGSTLLNVYIHLREVEVSFFVWSVLFHMILR
jgi:hypothetical protein